MSYFINQLDYNHKLNGLHYNPIGLYYKLNGAIYIPFGL
jgi:hypothetical protein